MLNLHIYVLKYIGIMFVSSICNYFIIANLITKNNLNGVIFQSLGDISLKMSF